MINIKQGSLDQENIRMIAYICRPWVSNVRRQKFYRAIRAKRCHEQTSCGSSNGPDFKCRLRSLLAPICMAVPYDDEAATGQVDCLRLEVGLACIAETLKKGEVSGFEELF